MNHDQLKDILFELKDGVLTGAVRDQAQAHLADCADCRRELAEIQATAALLFKAPNVDPSERFVQSVMGRIDTLPAARRGVAAWLDSLRSGGDGLFYRRLAAAGAMAAAIAAAVIFRPVPETPLADSETDVVYMTEVLEDTVAEEDPAGPNFETEIETYFL
jgi:anti-sigma factor RsiW